MNIIPVISSPMTSCAYLLLPTMIEQHQERDEGKHAQILAPEHWEAGPTGPLNGSVGVGRKEEAHQNGQMVQRYEPGWITSIGWLGWSAAIHWCYCWHCTIITNDKYQVCCMYLSCNLASCFQPSTAMPSYSVSSCRSTISVWKLSNSSSLLNVTSSSIKYRSHPFRHSNHIHVYLHDFTVIPCTHLSPVICSTPPSDFY